MIPGMWTPQKLTSIRKRADFKKKKLDFSVFSPSTMKEYDQICNNTIDIHENSFRGGIPPTTNFQIEKSLRSMSNINGDTLDLDISKKVFLRKPTRKLHDSSPSLKITNLSTRLGRLV
jgi:hypothetical protein